MRNINFEMLNKKTENQALLWRSVHGIAPEDIAIKMDNAMLDWLTELTKCLGIWLDKGIEMSTGELILARANLGAVVECWLKFYYCVYYSDYNKTPITKKGKMVEPEDLSFEELKNFSCGKLWTDNKSKEYIWVESVQKKRNAIHAFKYREIGTAAEFVSDVDELASFVDSILMCFPPIEDYYDNYDIPYPAGYVPLNCFEQEVGKWEF